jgi:serine-type D-Ala-D-Ala carboxypeptidase
MLSHILRAGIRHTAGDTGVTPGGVLVYGDQGQDLATIPFGRSHVPPPDDVFEVTPDTIYDVASLTKPLVTAAALMKLDLDLDAPVAPLLPELTVPGGGRITFAHLLGHGSGLPAHLRFYERLRAGDRAGASSRREALLRMAAGTALVHAPGERAVYSDLGYILLGFAIERHTGKRLDQVAAELVTGPLGMDASFFVDLDPAAGGAPAGPVDAARRARIAPTERCPYRGLVRGEVHDDNAHAGGGIFGHAGLFATAGDVARFARAMVHAAAGQPMGGFAPAVVRRFFTACSAPGTTWRLGWEQPSPEPGVSHAGDTWPRDGVGHLGFTGCSLWLDPPRGRYAVLLTNRVHPGRDNPGIKPFRRAVMDAIVAALDRG